MNDILKYSGLVALVILAIITFNQMMPKHVKYGAAVNCNSTTCFTTIGVLTSFQDDGVAIFNGAVTLAGALTQSAAAAFTSTVTIGTSGTAVNQVNYGTCAILAYATTIAASSTATVDCSSTGRVGGTLTGITSTDNVMAMATTSLSSSFLGVKILDAHASTTAGYLTLDLVNETGTTFTWTGAASSTIAYQAVK